MTAFFDTHILSFLLATPVAGALLIALLPLERPSASRAIALSFSLLSFGIFGRMLMLVPETLANGHMALMEVRAWIPILNSFYRVGVDGMSLLLVGLTTLVFPIAICSDWKPSRHPRAFMSLLLLLETATLGAFVSLDLLLFYFFWELLLIPVFFLIGLWGREGKGAAALKFFIFTASGSVLLLLGILFLATTAATFDWTVLATQSLPLATQEILLALFGFAFLVKAPIFLLHTWSPATYSAAPTGTSIILASVLSKLGLYGLIRFCLPLFGAAIDAWQTPLMALAVAGILYGSLLAWVEPDLKRLVAYASMAHIGTALLAIFSLDAMALSGALFFMLAHGLAVAGLFLGIGFLDSRYGTTHITDYGGLGRRMPVLATLFFIVLLGAVSLPGTSGFVGEFLSLLGTFTVSPLLASLGAVGVILSAVYLLGLFGRLFLGPLSPRAALPGITPDLTRRETLPLLVIVLLILILGIYPNGILKKLNAPLPSVSGGTH